MKAQKDYAIEFLLEQGADPHIEDLQGKDACDVAKDVGIASSYPELQRCRPDLRKKPVFQADDEEVEKQYFARSPARALPQKDWRRNRKGQQVAPSILESNEKYNAIYRDLTEQHGKTSQRSASGEKNQANDQVDISMRLDEPNQALFGQNRPTSGASTNSQMKSQLQSLKQRALLRQTAASANSNAEPTPKLSPTQQFINNVGLVYD